MNHLKATCIHIAHSTAENELCSSKPDKGYPPRTGTASSGVVESLGVLVTKNLTMTQRRNSTRVKAPATCPIATANPSTERKDSVTLNPDGRAMLVNKRLITKIRDY